MTILYASFFAHKGKYVIHLEDDMRETECEGQFDIMQNRFDIWLEKKVKFKVVLDHKVASTAGVKDSKMSTKMVAWLQEHKVEFATAEAAPPITTTLAQNLRFLLMELDPESRQNWLTGKTPLKNLSTKTWCDVHAEIKQFIEKHSKETKNTLGMEYLNTLETLLNKSAESFPVLATELKKGESKAEKVLTIFRKCKENERLDFAQFIIHLGSVMSGICVTNALVQALKTDDRVFFCCAQDNNQAAVNQLLTSTYGMELQVSYPAADEDATEPLSDKEFGLVVDGFQPKAKPKSEKDKKKKAAQKKKKQKEDGGAAESKGEKKAEAKKEDKPKAAESKTTASGSPAKEPKADGTPAKKEKSADAPKTESTPKKEGSAKKGKKESGKKESAKKAAKADDEELD